MEHVVFFTGADGGAQFRRVATLEEAVRYVEHLRNDGGVEDPRVFALTEVPLAFKAVYRVEVPGLDAPEAPVVEEPVPAVVADAEPVAEPVAEAVAEPEAEPEPVAVAAVPEPFAAEVFPAQPEPASNGKGGRGLGFFTR